MSFPETVPGAVTGVAAVQDAVGVVSAVPVKLLAGDTACFTRAVPVAVTFTGTVPFCFTAAAGGFRAGVVAG